MLHLILEPKILLYAGQGPTNKQAWLWVHVSIATLEPTARCEIVSTLIGNWIEDYSQDHSHCGL